MIKDMKWPEDFMNKVINADCLEVMKDMPDKCVDLVVTSPPYNMGGVSLGYQPNSKINQKHYDQYDDNKDETEYCEWLEKIIRECLRLSRYVMWNVQPTRSTRGHILDLQNKFASSLKDYFIWEKQAVSNITAKQGGLAKGWEFVFMLGGDNKTIFEYNNFPANGYVPNIKTWYKSEFFEEHHATFPRELPSYFINYFSKETDLIFDPFLGSGTTALAAKQLKRNFIGIEISPEYCKIAEERLKQDILL